MGTLIQSTSICWHGSFAETGHHFQQPLLCLAVGAETLGPDEQMELVAGFSHM